MKDLCDQAVTITESNRLCTVDYQTSTTSDAMMFLKAVADDICYNAVNMAENRIPDNIFYQTSTTLECSRVRHLVFAQIQIYNSFKSIRSN